MEKKKAMEIVHRIQPMDKETKTYVRNNFNQENGYFSKNLDHEAPIVVCDCISFIRNRGFYETGVFRIPGNLDVVNTLKQKYDQRFSTPDLKNQSGYSVLNHHKPTPSVNDVASLLKSFFTELPEPLVPKAITLAMLDVAKLNLEPMDEGLYLGKLVKRIPSPNRECLGLLVSFLRELCAFKKFNHMSAENLATCFVLSIFGKGDPSLQIVLVTIGCKIIKQLIAGEIRIFMPSVSNVRKNTRYKDTIVGEREREVENKTLPPPVPPKRKSNLYQGLEAPKVVEKRALPAFPAPPERKRRSGNKAHGYGTKANDLFGGI